MSMQDPISDMLTRIRNGIMRDKEVTRLPFSKYKMNVLEVLRSEGFIKSFEMIEEGNKKNILVYLKYAKNGNSVLNKLTRVSKPSCRQYLGAGSVKPLMNGIGISILSTSKGVLSDKQCREQNVGGEIICEIY
jgi:small subunit ribosomal protein S8